MVMTAMKHASKAHIEWDRAKRQWLATIAMSKQNHRTKDSEMLAELQIIIEKGQAADDRIVAIETAYKSEGPMELKAVEELRTLCDELFTQKKEGAIRSGMLMSWVRMK